MFVWNEVSVEVHLLQPIRVRCAHCGVPFLYLAQSKFAKKVRGAPYISLVEGKERRQTELLRQVHDEVERRLPLTGVTDRLARSGVRKASCPLCRFPYPLPKEKHYTRPEMLRSTVMVFGVIGAALGLVAVLLFVHSWDSLLSFPLAGLLLGGLFGTAYGLRVNLDYAPQRRREQDGPDPLAMTDVEFRAGGGVELGDGAAFLWDLPKTGFQMVWMLGDGHLVVPVPMHDATEPGVAGVVLGSAE